MAKFMKLEIKGKEYLIGFSNRAAALRAERAGFFTQIQRLETNPIESYESILKLGLLEKQPTITNQEVSEILDEISNINQDDKQESINYSDISTFLINQYQAFLSTQGKKKVKKLEIVEM